MQWVSVQINKQAGFSLTSILVALGVTALLFVGINQITQNQQDTQSHVTDSMTTKEIRNHIEENIDCLATGINALACDDPNALIKLVSRNGLILVDDDPNKLTRIDKWQIKASCKNSILVYAKPWRKKDPLKKTSSPSWINLISANDRLCHKGSAQKEITRVATDYLRPISNFVPYDECGSQRWNFNYTDCRSKDSNVNESCYNIVNRELPDKSMMQTYRIWEQTVYCNDDEVVIGGGAVCAPNLLVKDGDSGCYYNPLTMPEGPPEACRRGGGFTMYSGPVKNNGWQTRCCTNTFAAKGERLRSTIVENYKPNFPVAQAFCRKIGGNGDIK